ncbi:aspartate/glutamate racemase family protein [Pseudophaeobacter sp.]|jgi:aspartate racemase|uniref:aspartate/glutamate racemase family protein n=1 Tax=Pseudophaeobacter sp. TaxID=1971739 RepID=UPI0025FDA124|nr:aspartate/glutamate racemase family protein [uncultured Pseudophaeobacter sp.]
MKKIGILGGVGWASTLDYYRGICAGSWQRQIETGAEAHNGPLPCPKITIESVNQAETRSLRGRPEDEASWAAFDAVFRDGLLVLQAAGCDFAVIASNTPHARLHAIRQGVEMPVLSIFDATAQAVAKTKADSALVIGTAVTMQARNYAEVLAPYGIQANPTLPTAEIAEAQSMIDQDFHGGASPEAQERLLRFCQKHASAGEAVILACTELPLAFPDHIDEPCFEAAGVLFINPSAAHVAAALELALGEPQNA